MTGRSKLTFAELLETMAGCFMALLFVLFVTSELLRHDRELEAAARLDAGVAWEEPR